MWIRVIFQDGPKKYLYVFLTAHSRKHCYYLQALTRYSFQTICFIYHLVEIKFTIQNLRLLAHLYSYPCSLMLHTQNFRLLTWKKMKESLKFRFLLGKSGGCARLQLSI